MLSLLLNTAFSISGPIMAEGITLALLGLVVVILSLILIMIFLDAIGAAFKKVDVKGNSKQKELNAKVVTESTKTQKTLVDDDEEIVAAIMAAISCHTGKPLTSFRVVKFEERI